MPYQHLPASPSASAANFYDPIQTLDPDSGRKVMACFGGSYTTPTFTQGNMPFRGLDSSYTDRWCSSGTVIKNANNTGIRVNATTTKCDHYTAPERAQIPVMSQQVAEAIKFLGKDDQGFFMMYEQGDVSTVGFATFVEVRT
jgi:alkaline phosphatase